MKLFRITIIAIMILIIVSIFSEVSQVETVVTERRYTLTCRVLSIRDGYIQYVDELGNVWEAASCDGAGCELRAGELVTLVMSNNGTARYIYDDIIVKEIRS